MKYHATSTIRFHIDGSEASCWCGEIEIIPAFFHVSMEKPYHSIDQFLIIPTLLSSFVSELDKLNLTFVDWILPGVIVNLAMFFCTK